MRPGLPGWGLSWGSMADGKVDGGTLGQQRAVTFKVIHKIIVLRKAESYGVRQRKKLDLAQIQHTEDRWWQH